MYDEVMQLIALAKNDEQYFKRIEELKAKQMELAHVMEIAKTLGEADKHLAMARQKAEEVVKEAEGEAIVVRVKAETLLEENKKVQASLENKRTELSKLESELQSEKTRLKEVEKQMEDVISEHRKLTAMRTEEMEKAQKVKADFEGKLRQMREIASH